MKIFNCSRKYVLEHRAEIEADESIFVISINGFYKDFTGDIKNDAPPISNRKGLIIYFDDATLDDIGKPDIVKIFDRKQALCIFESVEDAFKSGKERILVHCGAGISRSSAISQVLNNFVNIILSENEADWEYNAKYGFEIPPIPNQHVKSVMRDVLYKEILAK